MKLSGTCAMILGMLGLASSPQGSAADVWTPSLIPLRIQVTEGGGVIIYFESQVSSTCGTRVHIYHNQNSVNESGVKGMHATALAALAAEKRISVMYDDSTSYCWGRYLTIER
jgi:hypothetical protein